MASNESKLAKAVSVHEQRLIAVLPLREEKLETKLQKRAMLLVAQYHDTKV